MTANDDQVSDSPIGWVATHIQRYVESDGAKGYMFYGTPTLLLCTHGRKTGKLRRTALIYGEDGDRYLVVASNGGSRHHPNWYLNLLEHPGVEVQIRAERFSARARPATTAEKPPLWRQMASIFPQYDAYQAKAARAGREIPLVILEPI